MGGSGPSSPANSSVFMASASSAVLPLINSVARLATAMAVSQPKDWNVARSITLRPFSCLYLIHIRSISPHSELPTVPMASALGNSPMFCGLAMASVIRFCRSSFIFLFSIYDIRSTRLAPMRGTLVNRKLLPQLIPFHRRINLLRPGVDAAAQTTHIRQAVPHEIGRGIEAVPARVIDDDQRQRIGAGAHDLLHHRLRQQH